MRHLFTRPFLARAQRIRRARPRLEGLEDRLVLDTYHVTSVLDSGPGTLRDAVTQANAHPGKDTIVFDVNGTINLTSGLPNLADDVDVQGPGITNLRINYNTGSSRPFTISTGVTANISSLNISGSDSVALGGLFYNDGGTLTIIDCLIGSTTSVNAAKGGMLYNSSSGTVTINGGSVSGGETGLNSSGGGIYNDGGTVTVSGCKSLGGTIFANGGSGGAIYNKSGTVTISANSSVSGTAPGLGCNGGGIYNNGGMVTISDSGVSGNVQNSGNDGGGIYNNGTITVSNSNVGGSAFNSGGIFNSSGTITVTGSALSGSAQGNSGGTGGAVVNYSTMAISGCTLSGVASFEAGGIANFGTLTLSDSTVSGCRVNRASGGGIYNGGSLTITGCTISGNMTVYDGGGIYNDGPLTVVNSTIAGNSVTGGDPHPGANGGGGIFTATSIPLSLINVTIINNTSLNVGGGLFVQAFVPGSAPILHNTLIAGNTSYNPISSRDDVYGPVDPGSDYNLIGSGPSLTGISNGTNHNQVGTPAIPINPLLASLGNYGGPTQTVAILPGSPAIDAGSSAYGGTSDQRGFSRVGATDIGAFESQGFRVTVTSGDGQTATVNTPFTSPLQLTVSSDFGEPVQNGVVTFTAPLSGVSATFPAGSSATLNASGQASVTARANSVAGPYTVSATTPGIAAPASFTLTNTAAAAVSLVVTGFPTTTIAGEVHTLTVTALDTYGNVATGYTGMVAFSSDDPQAALPGTSRLTNGIGVFDVALKTTGSNRHITVMDTATASLHSTESGITVTPAAASLFVVAGFPTTTSAGVAHTFTVTALDAYSNTATSYAGTIHFTSSDAQAGLPNDYTFTSSDAGVHTFSNAATFKTVGAQTITATDTAASAVTGTSPAITVIGVPPVLSPIGNMTATLGHTLTFIAQATDPNVPASPLAFSLDAGAPAGAAINPTTGAFSWTPTVTGTFSATVRVRNTTQPSLTAAQTFTITVVTPGSITGTVYFDDNANGIRDPGEGGLSGRTVYLDLDGNGALDAGEPTAITDASGNYTFTSLAIGNYSVRLALPYPNVALTLPASGGLVVTVDSGMTSSGGVNFGIVLYNTAYPVHPEADLYGPHPSANANTAFIKGLYRSVLGRDAEAAGVAYWLGALAGGTTRDQLAWLFINSTEHRQQEVNSYYRAFLGRPANDASSSFWVNLLQAEGDESEVVSGILTSDEYQARRPNNSDYINDLYALLLGRPADAAELAYWVQRLATGTSRHDVVDGFLHAQEAGALMAESYYAAFLHRPSDASRDYWIAQLMSRTATYGQLAADFLASAEFYQNGQKGLR
jgi:hypothetical protein